MLECDCDAARLYDISTSPSPPLLLPPRLDASRPARARARRSSASAGVAPPAGVTMRNAARLIGGGETSDGSGGAALALALAPRSAVALLRSSCRLRRSIASLRSSEFISK